MARIVHFEISVDDADRAAAFYRDAFGWRIDKWDGGIEYWMVTTGKDSEAGINGALTPRHRGTTTVNIIDVPSIDEAIECVVTAGGQAVTEVMPIPGVGKSCYCTDTEGNTFGLIEAEPDGLSI